MSAHTDNERREEGGCVPRIVRHLDALVARGVRVPVKICGLKRLAIMGEIGERILRKSVEVLEVTDKKRQYWPLMDLPMEERAIAEQCFPEAESTVPEHMRQAPEWLEKAETIFPANANVEAPPGSAASNQKGEPR